MSKVLLSSPESYESYIQREREAGREVPEYEEAKRFVEEEGFDIRYGHGHHLRYELQSVDKILSLLRHRQWSLFIAEEDASDFVCSDRPVALIIPILTDYIALAVLSKYGNEVIFAIAAFGYFPRIWLNCCCICSNV